MEHIKLEAALFFVCIFFPVYFTCIFGKQQRIFSHGGFRSLHGLSAADMKVTPSVLCAMYFQEGKYR